MNILFCSIYADGLHGSLLHILEYGKYLNSLGHKISYTAIFITESIKSLFLHNNIEIYPLEEVPKKEFFDIIWTFHTYVFPYLVEHGIKCEKVICTSLSPFVPCERISLYYNYMSLLTVVSEEVKNVHLERYGISPYVIPNHIPDEFLAISKQEYAKYPNKIAVVSNHPPQELLQLQKFAKDIDYYGSSVNNSKLMTPELLLNYDVVITIGKTIFYCMGLGIPVYEYDYFGGCGYINPSNIFTEEVTNFSGRSTKRKLSSKCIYDEILFNYNDTISNICYLKEIASSKYRLSNLVDFQLDLIQKSKDFVVPSFPIFRIFNDNCAEFIDLIKVNIHERNIIMTQQLEIDSLSKKISELNDSIFTLNNKISHNEHEFNKIKSLHAHLTKFVRENLPTLAPVIIMVLKILYKSYRLVMQLRTYIIHK